MKYTYNTVKNTKYLDKPNEDLILIDKNIFIILDGVSRSLENNQYPNPSPTVNATNILANSIKEYLNNNDNKDRKKLLKEAVLYANNKVKDYNDTIKHNHKAGAVGIILLIEKDKITYAYIGDCEGIILNQTKEYFTNSQTKLINKHHKEYTTEEIRNIICNNINHPYGYGVLNGDNRALDFLVVGDINIPKSLIIATDGLSKYLKNIKIEKLINMNSIQIINESIKLNNINQDDRSIIKIDFEV